MFKKGDMVLYSDPTDLVGVTGIYIIDSIKGDQVKLSPMCGRLNKLTTTINRIEKP